MTLQRGYIGWKGRQIPKWLYYNNRMWFGQNVSREQEGQYYSNRIWPWGQTSTIRSCSPLAELQHWSFALISISYAIIKWALPQCHSDNVLLDISWATHLVYSTVQCSFEIGSCSKSPLWNHIQFRAKSKVWNFTCLQCPLEIPPETVVTLPVVQLNFTHTVYLSIHAILNTHTNQNTKTHTSTPILAGNVSCLINLKY